MTNIRPKQKTSLTHKTANKNEDLKKTIKYYLDSVSDFYTKRSKFWKNYELANGVFDESYYNYVLNPINSAKEKHTKFPAKIRNYDIISPLLRLLQGEKTKRPFPYQVYVHNEDSHIQKREDMNSKINSNLQQMFINQLNNSGFNTGMETREAEPPKKIKEDMTSTWVDKRSKWGQHALNYIVDDQDVVDKWEDCFWDVMVTDYCFTYKDSFMDDVEYSYISPFEISYVANPNTKYIEDGEAAVRRTLMSVNEIVDKFGDILTDDQIEKYESSTSTGFSDFIQPNQFFNQFDGRSKPHKLIEVAHVVFKSLLKIGKITVINPLGELEVFEVDEFYKPSENEYVEWRWISQVFEGYEIDGKDIVGIRMLPNFRGSFNDPSKCKLPYNGRCFAAKNSKSISLVERMMPYQILYNIVHYRLELSLAKNKDKLTVMPIGLISDKKGMDMFDTMYYSDSTGYLFFDETKKNAIQALQYVKSIDAGLSQSIEFASRFLQEIKANLEDFVGVSRQRKGQISSSDGLGNSERAIFQSSMMTEYLFAPFDRFQQKEMQGLLDISRHAWRKGKKGQYNNSDMELQMFDIPEEVYANSELGVFVKISAKEQERLQMLKGLAQPFAQNGVKPSLVADIISSDNFQALKAKLERFEEEMALRDEEKAAADREAMIETQSIKAENDESNRLHEKSKQDNELAFKREELYAKLTSEAGKIDGDEALRQYNLAKSQLNELIRSNKKDEFLKNKEIETKAETERKKISKMSANKAK